MRAQASAAPVGGSRSQRRQRQVALALIGTGLGVVLVYLALHALGMRIQATDSFPKGLYWLTGPVSEPIRGRLVLACPPGSIAVQIALERHYLHNGHCPGGSVPLIKRIVGLPGEIVGMAGGVRVGGKLWPNSQPFTVDAAGRALPRYSGGIVPIGAVFLISDYHPASFDSRYFGPVPLANVDGYVEPVLTW